MISRTPLLSYFREPSRFLLWFVLAVAIFAAWGVEEATGGPQGGWLKAARGCGGWPPSRSISALGFVVVHTALRQNERVLLSTCACGP